MNTILNYKSIFSASVFAFFSALSSSGSEILLTKTNPIGIHDLTPEDKEAYQVLQEGLENSPNWFVITEQKENMLTTGYLAYLQRDSMAKYLPKGIGWHWNYGPSKKTFQIKGYDITMAKYYPQRNRNTTTAPPKYQVWIYELTKAGNHLLDTSAMWCKKGEEPHKEAEESYEEALKRLKEEMPKEILQQDLLFLQTSDEANLFEGF